MILPLLATFCLQSNILPFLKQVWTVLVSNFPRIVGNQAPILWVLPPVGYGLWVIAVVWVMECFSLRTNLDGIKRSMG